MVRKNTFAFRFTEAVHAKGLSQDEVAKRLGTSKSLVSNWANGKTIPALKNSQKLSKLFGLSVEYLLTGKKGNDTHGIKNDNSSTSSQQGGSNMTEAQRQLGFIIENGNDADVEFLMGKIGRIYNDTYLKKITPSSKRSQ